MRNQPETGYDNGGKVKWSFWNWRRSFFNADSVLMMGKGEHDVRHCWLDFHEWIGEWHKIVAHLTGVVHWRRTHVSWIGIIHKMV